MVAFTLFSVWNIATLSDFVCSNGSTEEPVAEKSVPAILATLQAHFRSWNSLKFFPPAPYL